MFCTYYNGAEFLLKLYITAIYGVMFQLADTINFDDGSALHISSSVVSFFYIIGFEYMIVYLLASIFTCIKHLGDACKNVDLQLQMYASLIHTCVYHTAAL